jgi:DNA-binding LacI/PurR family transcriptional regulator
MKVSDQLKKRILADYLENGKAKVGDKLPTIVKLSKQYNVSATTIGKTVEVLAAEGWLVNRRGSGLYVAQPSDESRRSSSQKVCRIGCICHNVTEPSLDQKVLVGISHVAEFHRATLEMARTNWHVEDEQQKVKRMVASGVQGIILYPTPFRNPDEEYLAREFRDIPIVIVDLYESKMKRPHVIFDNYAAGRDMTKYIFGKGRERVAFVTIKSETGYRSLDDRLAGYRGAFREGGLSLIPEWVTDYDPNGEKRVSNFYEALERVLSVNPAPNAIICPSDGQALWAISYLRRKGISVPGDILVAGFDNLPMNNALDPWPTTNPDFLRLGERAAELLLDCMESQDMNLSEIVLSAPLCAEDVRQTIF